MICSMLFFIGRERYEMVGQNRKQVGSSGMTVPGIVSDSSQSVLRRNQLQTLSDAKCTSQWLGTI